MSYIENVYRQRKKEGALSDLLIMALEEKPTVQEYYLRLGVAEIKEQIRDGVRVIENYHLHEKYLKALSKFDFESYLLYMEWDREPSRKFYEPRRKALAGVVYELQKLADGELDLLAVSLPPGTGKTTLALFYLTWLAGLKPNEPILCASHSHTIVQGMCEECFRLMRDDEYKWGDLFNYEVARKAKDLRLDVDKRQRFETLEFTSIGSGNAGKFRAGTLLYCDDLVEGIETAMSYERLEKLWSIYTTDLRQRKKGNCRELHIATRWSVHDVIGRLEERYGKDERAKFISVPALDENDESNFDYPIEGDHFSTEFYHEQREIMDTPSWNALYMNEPIEREGLLYEKEELRYYFDLPKDENDEIIPPDNILAVCDVKSTGDDYCVIPVCYQYGEDLYIEDVLCDNGKVEMVDARMVDILMKNNVNQCQFESNAAGYKTAEKVDTQIKKNGGKCHITSKHTQTNKLTRIITRSAWVKAHCLFKESYKPKSDYATFMKLLFTFTQSGKNKHDDVPDALAQLCDYVENFGSTVTILKRWF